MNRLLLAVLITSTAASQNPGVGAEPIKTIRIESPMSPPTWALLERELLRANVEACQRFFSRYFDERGYLMCVERWGGDDGPDDAIENLLYWPQLHAAGASDIILRMYKKAWEGHLRQYTEAKTTEVPFARDGMYYKEFPVMFDWLHNSEALSVFALQGLSDPHDHSFRRRMRRYAGFYLNEDPQAPNYDSHHKIIRSLFNGSRGPLLRKTTALDWAGDAIEVEGRFVLGHGEEDYEQMLEHFDDYIDIVGDHPSNLMATCLALNAYMIEHEPKYRSWILEYVDAWRERMIANGNIIPSNIGLDGTTGGATDGKWYGGVYGWAHSVVVPRRGERITRHINTTRLAFDGFANAFLLTGDNKYLDVWRRQIDAVNFHRKEINGVMMYPHMYGDDGWYDYTAEPFSAAALDLYCLSMRDDDLARVPPDPWLEFLQGDRNNYPEAVLRNDLERIRSRAEAMHHDQTTPDTRLSDDPEKYNPASVVGLVRLTMGGVIGESTGLTGNKNRMVFHSRLRYFDPLRRRAGLPQDVAALIERMTDDTTTLMLVNVNQSEDRELIVQAGAYGEHEFISATVDGSNNVIDASNFTVRLTPGAGSRLHIKMNRYANQPTIRFPWDR